MESVEAECGNRDGSRGIRWVKKKREKSILCIREFIIDNAPLSKRATHELSDPARRNPAYTRGFTD